MVRSPHAPLPPWWTDPFASASAAAVAASAGSSSSNHAAAYMTSAKTNAAPGPSVSAAGAHVSPAFMADPQSASASGHGQAINSVDLAANDAPDVRNTASGKRPFLPPRRRYDRPTDRDASTSSIREIIAARERNLTQNPEGGSRMPAQLAWPGTHARDVSAEAAALQAAPASPNPDASEPVPPEMPARLPCLRVRLSIQPPQVLSPNPDSFSPTTVAAAAAAGTASMPSSSQTAAQQAKHEASSLKTQPQTGPEPQRASGVAQDAPQGSAPAVLPSAPRQTAQAAAEAPELLWSPPSHARDMHCLGARLLDSPDLQDWPKQPKGKLRDPSGSESIQHDGQAVGQGAGQQGAGPFSASALEARAGTSADVASNPGMLHCTGSVLLI